jgi:hypothetical protein
MGVTVDLPCEGLGENLRITIELPFESLTGRGYRV